MEQEKPKVEVEALKNWADAGAEEKQRLIFSLCKSLGDCSLAEAKLITQTQVVMNMEGTKLQESSILSCEHAFNSSKREAVDKFKATLSDITKGFNPDTVSIQVSSQVGQGDDFLPIESVKKLEGEEEVTVMHNQGEVMLIDFWATWCGPCQGPMAHNQKMLEKNAEEWNGKVRIVGVSLDRDMDQLKKVVNQNKWNKIEHYFKGASKSDELYGVEGIPHVVLIDKKGTIVYVGHPDSRKLEEDINKLIKGEDLDIKSESKGESASPVAETKQFIDPAEFDVLFKEAVTVFESLKDKPEFAELGKKCMRAVLVLLKEGEIDSATGKENIKGRIIKQLMAKQPVLDKLKPMIDAKLGDLQAHFYIQDRCSGFPVFNLDRANTCTACQVAIAGQTIYLAREDQKEAKQFCEECSKKEDFVMMLIRPDDIVDNLNDIKYTTNILEEPQPNEIYSCNMCRESGKMARYKCAHCIDFDFCDGCYMKYEAGNQHDIPEDKRIDFETNDGHSMKKHPFYRMLGHQRWNQGC